MNEQTTQKLIKLQKQLESSGQLKWESMENPVYTHVTLENAITFDDHTIDAIVRCFGWAAKCYSWLYADDTLSVVVVTVP